MGNLGSLSSILGLLATIFLIFEAKKLRSSFLRRARLPQITEELSIATSELSENLKFWRQNSAPALHTFSKIEGLLGNIRTKLPGKEKKLVDEFLTLLHPKKYLVLTQPLSQLTDDEAWDRYTKLNSLVTTFEQLTKDMKWD